MHVILYRCKYVIVLLFVEFVLWWYIQMHYTPFNMETLNIEVQNRTTIHTHHSISSDEYLRSYYHWIEGISGTKLINNISISNCVIPSLPVQYQLPFKQSFNQNILFTKTALFKANQFSILLHRNRVIIIECDTNPYASESRSIYNSNYKQKSRRWRRVSQTLNSTVWVLQLQQYTQATWIRCGQRSNFHYSLLSLQTLNATLYDTKRRQLQQTFGTEMPPNIVLFIIDSTSRSSFVRSLPNTMDYLSNLLIDRHSNSPVDIIQFFRYSTVGWGTVSNLNALLGGFCAHCNNQNHSYSYDLSRFYDNFGYYVPGLHEDVDKTYGEYSDLYHYLTGNVLPHSKDGNGPAIGYRYDVEWASLFTLQLQKIGTSSDPEIPFFVPIHSSSNHVAGGIETFQLDEIMHNFVRDMDKFNTVVHIVSDHGSLIGRSLRNNVFTKWEMKNPVSIMLIPKTLSVIDIDVLKQNEQRMVNHYDMHLFYKQLLYELSHKSMDYKKDIEDTLPRDDDGFILSEYDLMHGLVAVNRSCHKKNDMWCFCNVMRSLPLSDISHMRQYVTLSINTINNLTGNGEYDCRRLDPSDFKITFYMEMESVNGKNVEIVIEYIMTNEREANTRRNSNTLLSFAVRIHINRLNQMTIPTILHGGGDIPDIMRTDYFKYENCITTDYDSTHYVNRTIVTNLLCCGEPVLINKNNMVSLLQKREPYNLRLCKCK
eukprot:48240_1